MSPKSKAAVDLIKLVRCYEAETNCTRPTDKRRRWRTMTHFDPKSAFSLYTLNVHPDCNSTGSYSRNVEVFLLLQKVSPVLSIPTYMVQYDLKLSSPKFTS